MRRLLFRGDESRQENLCQKRRESSSFILLGDRTADLLLLVGLRAEELLQELLLRLLLLLLLQVQTELDALDFGVDRVGNGRGGGCCCSAISIGLPASASGGSVDVRNRGR